jgi:hypothetical protein
VHPGIIGSDLAPADQAQRGGRWHCRSREPLQIVKQRRRRA